MSKIYGYFICAKPSAALQTLENMFYRPFIGFQNIEMAEQFASFHIARICRFRNEKLTAAICSIDSNEFAEMPNPIKTTEITEEQRQKLTVEKQMVTIGDGLHPRTRSGTDTAWVHKTIELCYAALLKRREEAELEAAEERAEQQRKEQEAFLQKQKQEQHKQDVLSKCVHSPQTSTYIHYGNTMFDPEHKEVKWAPFQYKPGFGFWAVNQNMPDYTDVGFPVSWRAKLKAALESDSNVFPRYYDPTQKMHFTIKPEAKIFHAQTRDDMQWLQETYPRDDKTGVDYTKVAKDFDGMLYDYKALGNQYGTWDVDSLAIFNGQVVQVLPAEPAITVYGAQFITDSEIEQCTPVDWRPKNKAGETLSEEQEREQGRCMEIFASTRDVRHELISRDNAVGVIMYKVAVPLSEFEQWHEQDNGSFGLQQIPFFNYSIATCTIRSASPGKFITGLSPHGMYEMLTNGALDETWYRQSSFNIDADNYEDATAPFHDGYVTICDATLDEQNVALE